MIIIPLLLFVIATGVVYVVHLQRRTMESQEALIRHFIDLVRVTVETSVASNGHELREQISKLKAVKAFD